MEFTTFITSLNREEKQMQITITSTNFNAVSELCSIYQTYKFDTFIKDLIRVRKSKNFTDYVINLKGRLLIDTHYKRVKYLIS